MTELKEVKKTWTACTQCPFNYDSIECKLYPDEYAKDYMDDKFDQFEDIPDWCDFTVIKFYKESDND